jgi:hypothetical protein
MNKSIEDEAIDIEGELDLDSLEELDIDDSSDLEGFDFKL